MRAVAEYQNKDFCHKIVELFLHGGILGIILLAVDYAEIYFYGQRHGP